MLKTYQKKYFNKENREHVLEDLNQITCTKTFMKKNKNKLNK